MNQALAKAEPTREIERVDLSALERVIVAGDLSKLTPAERWQYYIGTCQSVGLNPFTRPFDYLTMDGKLVLYANKGCAEQLRALAQISISAPSITFDDGMCVVTVEATDARGRKDSDIGIVPLDGLKAQLRANAIMKAVTKAKRRVTLSMCGLNVPDETEVDSIPGARVISVQEAGAGHPEALPAPGPGAKAEGVRRAEMLARWDALIAQARPFGEDHFARYFAIKANKLSDDELATIGREFKDRVEAFQAVEAEHQGLAAAAVPAGLKVATLRPAMTLEERQQIVDDMREALRDAVEREKAAF